jgi:hypothetical protein
MREHIVFTKLLIDSRGIEPQPARPTGTLTLAGVNLLPQSASFTKDSIAMDSVGIGRARTSAHSISDNSLRVEPLSLLMEFIVVKCFFDHRASLAFGYF